MITEISKVTIAALALLLAILFAGMLTGCAPAPTVVTRTITIEKPVEHIVPVPAALSADCVPAPLADATVGAALDRLASAEGALADCRDHLAKIRALPGP